MIIILPDKIQSKLRDNDSGPHSVLLHTPFPVRDMIRKLTHDDFDPNGFETYSDNDFGPKQNSIRNIFRSESPDDSSREIN